MTYKVKITPFALSQLENTVKYISEILLVPETALKWLDILEAEINRLNTMPSRHPLTEEEPWRSRGIHKKIVKGFFIYYLINEKTSTIYVTAVIYGRRDQIAALKEMDKN